MVATTVTLRAPASGFKSVTVRPTAQVSWTGGTGGFDVEFEWDTVNTFDSVDLISDVNTSVTSPNEGVPPSDLGGSTWYVRATVKDVGDSNATKTSLTASLTFIDPDLFPRFLYQNHNVGVFADDFDNDAQPRFLYVLQNVTTDVPVPFIEKIGPSLGVSGDTVVITGQGFDNATRDWSVEARLYDDPNPAGASYVAMSEVAFVDGTLEDVLTVTIPGGASSGWVVVANDSGA